MIIFDALDDLASNVATKLGSDLLTIRLVLSVLLGYPIAIIYSVLSSRWSIKGRQAYLLSSGIFLFLWNFGLSIIHMFIGIGATMLVNYLYFRSRFTVVFAFIFNMGYLLLGSWVYNRGTYDINWTTPYCILCLRLIGLTWDLFDASKPESERSAQQKLSALPALPGVLETISFCFVPTAFISGPQFTMRHYQAFIDGSLRPMFLLRNRSFADRFIYNAKVRRTVVRFTLGVLGILLLSRVLPYYSADVLLTEEFLHKWSFFSRFAFMAIFSQIVLFRYVAVWLIGEGACVLLGLGCTGLVHIRHLDKDHGRCKTKDGTPVVRTKALLDRRDSAVPWTAIYNKSNREIASYDPSSLEVREADHKACANISLANLLLATNTDNIVAGFNINTNKWMLEYVYKRLRFLGNKQLSQILTLTFLAVWHGIHSGYYVNFFLEFITVVAEKDALAIIKRSIHAHFLYETIPGLILTSIIGKLHVMFLLATPLVPFYLLKFHLYYPVLKSTYFIGFIYLLWPLARPLWVKVFPKSRSVAERHEKSDMTPTVLSNGCSTPVAVGDTADNEMKKRQ
ncbi:unnamed protein product [Calicophoron daubneyi]|uniref:Lysophospholipid acyltransferase 5 n=1 Tax=Calicophoron daubneyi TaxID=300641 RepID=A0AAV2TGR4_CALDB